MKNRILFLTFSDRRGASSRYRVFNFLPLLEADGFQSDVVTPSPKGRGLRRPIARREEEAQLLEHARDADLIVIQKRLFRPAFIKRLQRLAVPIVFDFDDAIFTSPSGDRSWFTRARVARRLAYVLKASTAVIAGNGYLAEYTRRYNARVEVLPTAIDPDQYQVKNDYATDKTVLGWIGANVNQPYLASLQPAFQTLTSSGLKFSLRVVSGRELKLEGMPVDNRPWSETTEMDDLLSFDIGLMPMPDDEWTRGKCAFKAIQYMAAGIPAVCSPVGMNNDLIQHGVNGYLCQTNSEWIDVLRQLSTDAKLRKSIGRAGRATVETEYSVSHVGHRLSELLRSCLSQS